MLNPGVLLDDDPVAHLRHIKVTPTVEEEVDRCVECGYCEPVCPSRDLTLTPRQRIVVRRAIADAEAAGDDALATELESSYEYSGVQTCAVDGMCGTVCPVLINTGDLVRRLRRERRSATADRAWVAAARHWKVATRGAAAALTLADTVPPAVPRGASRAARALAGAEQVPAWSTDLPRGGRSRRRGLPAVTPEAVYLPACVNTMFGTEDGGVQDAFEQLCATADIALLVPRDIDSLCCGTPWSSKGMATGYAAMKARTVSAVRSATRDGALPLVCDASSCTEGLIKMLQDEAPQVTVIDAVQFTAEKVLPQLSHRPRLRSLTVHPTCSSTQLGIDGALLTLAREVADDVVVPQNWGCCAFAGDRGMLHPELTASATAREATEVQARNADAHASCNRTCEMGMTRATGKPYRHVLELLAEVTASVGGRAPSGRAING
jgi:D-lactate dehydrogenase